MADGELTIFHDAGDVVIIAGQKNTDETATIRLTPELAKQFGWGVIETAVEAETQ